MHSSLSLASSFNELTTRVLPYFTVLCNVGCEGSSSSTCKTILRALAVRVVSCMHVYAMGGQQEPT